MKTFYVVRHGETQYNVRQLVQGWCDSPLTEKGVHQACAVGQRLRDVPFAAARSGDLGRQQETANIILSKNCSETVPELHTDRRLRENYFGSFEGTEEADLIAVMGKRLNADFPAFIDLIRYLSFDLARLTDLVAESDPSGEAETAVACGKRFREGLLAAASSVPDGSNVLVVTSGDVMSKLVSDLSVDHRPHLVKNGEILVLNVEQNHLEIKEFISDSR